MRNDQPLEMPFEYLTRKEDGKQFEEEIIKNWYIARHFVLDKFSEMKIGFSSDSKEHLHVVVNGDSPIMLSIARQVALTAHFINYRDGSKAEEPQNRTVITIVSKNPHIIEELEKEEYLCNLPKYCKVINRGEVFENDGFYIDIELHITESCPEEESVKSFSEQDVDAYIKGNEGKKMQGIDTCKAIYASRMYDLGAELYNIPAEDIHCTERYSLALDVFQHEMLKKKLKKMTSKEWSTMSLSKLKEKISNILCADCFSLREACLKKAEGNYRRTRKVWAKYNEQLSVSEHARWVVEKLVMGYRPLNSEERYYDETLHVQFKNKDKKKKYRDSLKRIDSDPAHIDLCSYRDLRRINPDDLKFDSFLMLAIPNILAKVNE